MDANQSRVIELLREVHLLAFKEIERLNLRIAELESQSRHQPAPITTATTTPQSNSKPSEMMTDRDVAAALKMSIASVRRWRRQQTGPKFMKIGSLVRYRRSEVEAWIESCRELK